jgi:hypothetical protein
MAAPKLCVVIEIAMSTVESRPEVGQWYVRWDSGAIFKVAGYEARADAIRLIAFDGRLHMIDGKAWARLPLTRVKPPKRWMPAEALKARSAPTPCSAAGSWLWIESPIG